MWETSSSLHSFEAHSCGLVAAPHSVRRGLTRRVLLPALPGPRCLGTGRGRGETLHTPGRRLGGSSWAPRPSVLGVDTACSILALHMRELRPVLMCGFLCGYVLALQDSSVTDQQAGRGHGGRELVQTLKSALRTSSEWSNLDMYNIYIYVCIYIHLYRDQPALPAQHGPHMACPLPSTAA